MAKFSVCRIYKVTLWLNFSYNYSVNLLLILHLYIHPIRINVCHQIHRVVGEVSLKKSFRLYFCYYRTCRSVISSFDCIKKRGFNLAQQIVPSQECVPLNVTGDGSCLSGMS